MQSNWLKRAGILSLGTSFAAIASTAALAAEDTGGFEEIVVTAQKREQIIQDVPISISTLGGKKVSEYTQGGADIKFLAARIPGVNAESSNGRVAPRFYIRGLGNTDFDLAASQPVSIVMDDVVMENVVLKSFPLFDVDHVEVLRGPQGTLFGRNTPAGIIKFDTVKPSQEASGYVNASYGELGTGTIEAAVGGPISDVLSARVSALWAHQDDWIDNDYTGEDDALGGMDDFAGRVQFLYTPTESVRALFNLHGRTYDGTAAVFRAGSIDKGSNKLNDVFDWNTVYFNDTHNNPQSYDNWGGSFNLAVDVSDNFTVTSITAYETADGFSRGDIDGGNETGPGTILFQSTSEDAIKDLEQVTEEIRIAGQVNDKLFIQTGFFYFDSDFTVRSNPFFAPASDVRHQNETWAVFGQASYDITDATSITVGVRYTDDDKSMDAVSGILGGATSHADLAGDKFTWDVAVNHFINEDVSVYAKIATGFRAPTIQGRDIAFGSSYSVADSETIKSGEAGFKANLMDNRMRWSGAAYYWDVSGLQLTAVGGDSNSIRLMNADKAIGYGLETDIEVLLGEYLTFNGGFAWTETEIKDDLRISFCALCTVTDPIIDGLASIKGNRLPQAPAWTANFGLDYVYPMDDGRELFASTDWAFQGRTNLFLYTSEEFYTKNTFEGGMRIGFRWENGTYEAALFGRNITNEANIKGAIDFTTNAVYVGEPRVIGLSFGAKF